MGMPQLTEWSDHLIKGDFPEWHGYSLGGSNGRRITLLVDPGAKPKHVSALQRKISDSHPGSLVTIFKIRRFRRTQGPAAAPAPIPIPSPTQAHPGDGITATGDDCGTKTSGTIGAFLIGETGDVWLLTNNHVLVPGPFCLPDVTVRSASDSLLSTKVLDVEIQRLGNLVDAAIAKVDPPEIMVTYPGIDLTTTQPPPCPPSGNSVIAKLGAVTRLTRGHFVGTINAAEIGDPQGAVHEFADQLLIKSIDGGPFLAPGDSGSLAIVDGKPLGLFFANPDGDADDPETKGENPQLFGLANPFAAVMSAVNAIAGDQLTLMLPQVT